MSLYNLPQLNIPEIKNKTLKFLKNRIFQVVIISVVISCIVGFLAGIISINYFYKEIQGVLQKLKINQPTIEKEKVIEKEYTPQTSQEEAIINVVKEYSGSVVSIVITEDVPIIEEYFYNPFPEFGAPFEFQIPGYRQKGTEKKETGEGSGFIVSADGLILTNKHVVLNKEADYTVLTNDGKKYPAKILATDPVQDLAVIKINAPTPLPFVKLGDSENIQIGQTVIAIGNALGEFRNTVSVGVISGLGRTITASGGGGFAETLEDIIQTDAAINRGNSGGPLLNLKGEVIGINTAIAENAQNIGFALPINRAKRDIEQVKKEGRIVYPFLGVRYVLINEQVQKKNNLSVDYGALVTKGNQGEAAVMPGSAADKAGIKAGDIILEFNGEKITTDNSMAKIISKYHPGDKVVLKILRGKEIKIIEVVLGEREE
jgi:serine protease Do